MIWGADLGDPGVVLLSIGKQVVNGVLGHEVASCSVYFQMPQELGCRQELGLDNLANRLEVALQECPVGIIDPLRLLKNAATALEEALDVHEQVDVAATPAESGIAHG